MENEALDLVVIGGGSAGVRCARTAAALGAKVALVEAGDLGGTCVNLGCIPKKLLAYGAHVAHEIAEARGMGWVIPEARLDWPALVAKKDAEIARLNAVYERLLVSAGVRVVRGRAVLEAGEGAPSVRVGTEVLRARFVVLATGGVPKRPPIPGVERALTSDEFFHLQALPRSIVIVGAGYVAVEVASTLAALGVQTTLLARRGLLAGFDPDVGAFLKGEMEKHGVRVREERGHVRAIESRGVDGVAVIDGQGEAHEAERALLAVGRTPVTRGLGLEALGVALRSDGAVIVDAHYGTTVPGLFAIGDVTARMDLTPIALAEGMAVARRLFGGPVSEVPYALTPTAVFSLPPVATVGTSEPDARARGPVRVFRTDFRPLKHTISGSTERTMMKLVVDAATDRVLGVHVVGADAPEMVQGFAVALTCGATKAQLDQTLGIHPTAAEELVTMRTPT
jgi:glutathione reductase (NADPH)